MESDPCPIAPVAEVMFGRWTSHILWELTHHGRLRFTELQRQVPAITPKVLSERLRQLERDGLVIRTYHPEVPPRVEYESTPLARTLIPVFASLVDWAEEHFHEVETARHGYDTNRAVG